MRVNANAVLRSWTLLAAFGGSYAPVGAHAQRGLRCVSVCLSVTHYSRTTGYEAAYERYQQLQCYKSKKSNVAILLKRLRLRDMA